MDKKKLIVVLGVPRSGTSAITRSLQTLGAEFGDSLVEGIEGVNNKGFWEDKSILDLNERMLQTLNKVWCDITPFSLSDFGKEELALYKKEAVELLQKKCQNHSFLALKEPRITKLLPFWKVVFEACDLKPTYIVALRKPSDVFNSFKRLENIMVRSADVFPINVDLIWLSYLSNTLQLFIEKEDALIVSYDSIIERPIESIKRISIHLDADVNPSELKEYAEEFVDKSLNHSESKDKEIFYLTEKLFHCYSTISKLDNTLISDKCILELSAIQHEFDKLNPLFSLVDLFREKFILESDLLRSAVEEKGRLSEDQDKIIEDKERLIEDKERLIEDKDSEIESKRCLILSLENEVEILNLERGNVQAQLEQLVKDNDVIIKSYSMRVTKPLRILSSFMKKAFKNAG